MPRQGESPPTFTQDPKSSIQKTDAAWPPTQPPPWRKAPTHLSAPRDPLISWSAGRGAGTIALCPPPGLSVVALPLQVPSLGLLPTQSLANTNHCHHCPRHTAGAIDGGDLDVRFPVGEKAHNGARRELGYKAVQTPGRAESCMRVRVGVCACMCMYVRGCVCSFRTEDGFEPDVTTC